MRDSKPSLVARDRTWRTTTLSTAAGRRDRKSTRLNSSHDQISYAVFCLKKKKKQQTKHDTTEITKKNETINMRRSKLDRVKNVLRRTLLSIDLRRAVILINREHTVEYTS